MTEHIAAQIYAKVKDICPTYYSEAEIESYPYAVYDVDVDKIISKDGVQLLSGLVTFHVYANDFDIADDRAALIDEALSAGLDEGFGIWFLGQSKTRLDQIWDIQLQYRVKQV